MNLQPFTVTVPYPVKSLILNSLTVPPGKSRLSGLIIMPRRDTSPDVCNFTVPSVGNVIFSENS
jgi:hypothetical protein